MKPEILIHRLDPDLPIPGYAKPGDAGADMYARTSVRIEPGERALVPTGFAMAMPEGFVALVVPRSGNAIKRGLTLLNTPGVIDAGYRGEVACIVYNADPREALEIVRGERIAQMLVMSMPAVAFTEVQALPGTQRAAGGFGSTGAL